jgi:LysM repeat protein
MSDKGLQRQPGGRDYVQESQGTVSGGSLVAKLGGPRNAAILGAGGTVALVALVALRKNKSSSSDSSTNTGDSTYDSGPYDMWNQWEAQYEQLQEQVNSMGGTTTATGPGSGTKIPTPLPAPITKPPIPTPAPKPVIPKPGPGPVVHKTVTVQKNDTLSKIAARNHITMATLKKLNPVYWTNKKYDNGNKIWAGDKVKVS